MTEKNKKKQNNYIIQRKNNYKYILASLFVLFSFLFLIFIIIKRKENKKLVEKKNKEIIQENKKEIIQENKKEIISQGESDDKPDDKPKDHTLKMKGYDIVDKQNISTEGVLKISEPIINYYKIFDMDVDLKKPRIGSEIESILVTILKDNTLIDKTITKIILNEIIIDNNKVNLNGNDYIEIYNYEKEQSIKFIFRKINNGLVKNNLGSMSNVVDYYEYQLPEFYGINKGDIVHQIQNSLIEKLKNEDYRISFNDGKNNILNINGKDYLIYKIYIFKGKEKSPFHKIYLNDESTHKKTFQDFSKIYLFYTNNNFKTFLTICDFDLFEFVNPDAPKYNLHYKRTSGE